MSFFFSFSCLQEKNSKMFKQIKKGAFINNDVVYLLSLSYVIQCSRCNICPQKARKTK